jgi:uncharacterized protein YwgA
MKSFTERKQLQKLGFLLQSFGFDIPFQFGWYIHGPYSSGLTRMLYEIVETASGDTEPLTQLERDRLEQFKKFLGDDLRDSDKLELLASIHYLRARAREVGSPDNDVLSILKEKKPYFTDEEIRECWDKSLELDTLTRK